MIAAMIAAMMAAMMMTMTTEASPTAAGHPSKPLVAM
jgi:hypothetical protein